MIDPKERAEQAEKFLEKSIGLAEDKGDSSYLLHAIESCQKSDQGVIEARRREAEKKISEIECDPNDPITLNAERNRLVAVAYLETVFGSNLKEILAKHKFKKHK